VVHKVVEKFVKSFHNLLGFVLGMLLVAVPVGAVQPVAESQLHMVLACDDAHAKLGEGFEVNEWALRSTLVQEVASSRLKLLNPDSYREGGAPPLTRKLLLDYLAALSVQPDDALIVYLACERGQNAKGEEWFRFSGDKANERNATLTREEILAVLQKKKVRLVGLITDSGTEYIHQKVGRVAISTVMPPITITAPLCEKLFFESTGVLNVASAAPGETARYYDNYTAATDIPEEDRVQKLVAAQVMGDNVGDDHDLQYGFIRYAENPLKGGYFTESLVKILQDNKTQEMTWEKVLAATETEMKDRFRRLPGKQQTVQLLAVPDSTIAQSDPQDPLGIEVEPADKGVKITAVHPDGLAAGSGLEVGEILLTVNGKPVASSEEVLAAAKISTPLIRVSGVDLEGKPFSFVMKAKERPQNAPGKLQPQDTKERQQRKPDAPSDVQSRNQPAGDNNESTRDPVEVGQKAARKILEQIRSVRHELKQEKEQRPLRVAVFPFVNSKGQVITATLDAATALAGELSKELSRSKGPALELVSPLELVKLPRQLLAGRAAPGDAEGQAVLEALNCDYLVTGQFDATSAAELLNASQPVVNIQLALHMRNLNVLKSTFQADTRSIQTAPGDPIGPFPLELISNGNNIVLKQEEREDLGTVYVAEIAPSMVGKPFSLRLTSEGATVGYRNRDQEMDQSRLFGVAIFINGVCSLGQPLGEAQFELGWGHWSQSPLHPLTAPGYVVTESTNGPKVEPKQQQIADGSVLNVDSYRTPLESSPMLFTIPTGGEGLITVYFFAEKMPGDRRIPRGGEAMIPTHFKPIKLVPWFDTPLLHTPGVLTHRIVYRLQKTN
jgi:hypothetical protein